MDPEGLLPHSQLPANFPQPQPDQSSPCPYIPHPEDIYYYYPSLLNILKFFLFNLVLVGYSEHRLVNSLSICIN